MVEAYIICLTVMTVCLVLAVLMLMAGTGAALIFDNETLAKIFLIIMGVLLAIGILALIPVCGLYTAIKFSLPMIGVM